MELVFVTPEDFKSHDTHLQNIISINSNHYWDCEEAHPEEEPEVLYA